MENCKNCKFWNRKKVISPNGSGMRENQRSENHKMVVNISILCKRFRKGKFDKKYIVLLSQ